VWKGNWCLEDRISSSLSQTVGISEARTGLQVRQVPWSHLTNGGRANQVQVEKDMDGGEARVRLPV
jgi:hypothetical protein